LSQRTDNASFKVFVLLPAYNESAALVRLIPEIQRILQSRNFTFEVCLIDDGSTDETQQLAGSWSLGNVRHLRHQKNQGYGAALRTGFLWVVENGDSNDIVASMDADNTHPPSDLNKIIETLAQGYDVVTTSYSMRGGASIGVPWKRRVMSWIANLIFQFFSGVPHARTFTNGYRGYRVGVIKKAFNRYGDRLIAYDGFPGGTDLFMKVAKMGARISEIPFILHYENRGEGGSKIHIVRTAIEYLNLAWDHFFSTRQR